MSEITTLTAEKSKAIKGFLQEWSNSIVREQSEKDFRKKALARIIKEQDLDKDEIKNMIELHVKEEKARKKIDDMNRAQDIYDSLYARGDDDEAA